MENHKLVILEIGKAEFLHVKIHRETRDIIIVYNENKIYKIKDVAGPDHHSEIFKFDKICKRRQKTVEYGGVIYNEDN